SSGRTSPTGPIVTASAPSTQPAVGWPRHQPQYRASPPKKTIHKAANCRSVRREASKGMSAQRMGAVSIQLELREVRLARGLVGFLRKVLLVQHAVFEHQQVHVGASEAAVGVLRRADDRLATHVEARVDEHRTAGHLVEDGHELV